MIKYKELNNKMKVETRESPKSTQVYTSLNNKERLHEEIQRQNIGMIFLKSLNYS